LLSLPYEKVFDTLGLPKLEVLKAHLLKEGRLDDEVCFKLISDAADILKKEPNLLKLKYPITVCGDVHGQFFDLAKLLEVGGDPEDHQYLFLGDYVDRGCFSSECVFLLFALKITYPKSVFLLRGNHECRQLTSHFNFMDECVYKYSQQVYEAVMGCFDCLPIAAVLENTFFCVHGGLSPNVKTLDDIRKLDRFREIPREGPLCDLMWSDPYDEEGEGSQDEFDDESDHHTNHRHHHHHHHQHHHHHHHQQQQQQQQQQQHHHHHHHHHHHQQKHEGGTNRDWFIYNSTRQCSVVFGVEATKDFLSRNKLTSIVRAHEAQKDGYKMHMPNEKNNNIPRVITIFSAPNYCDVYKNKAAVLKFDHNTLNIRQFLESPHPYYLPNFMDVFQWSLPFVAEKVTDMLAKMLHSDDDDDDKEEEVLSTSQTEAAQELKKKAPRLKQKVLAVTKVLRMYKMLRQNNEAVLQLKQLTPNHRIPFGLLSKGTDAIQQALTDFESAKQADLVNESRPSVEPRPSAEPNL